MNTDLYTLHITLEDDIADRLQEGSFINLRNDLDDDNPQVAFMEITQIDHIDNGLGVIYRDFSKLFKALLIPVKKAAARTKLLTLVFVYTLFTPSGLASFFVRGWRLEVVRRMALGQNKIPIAPSIQNLHDLGQLVKEGIRLFGAKILYDLPKLFILVAIGYDHFEMIIDWAYTIFGKVFLTPSTGSSDFSDFAADSVNNFSMTLGIELMFILLFSFIITPAFRITMIKYANGNTDYKGFFNVNELKDSFRLYKKYKTGTIQAYTWDLIVSVFSVVFGFVLIIFFPVITWLFIPFYKFLFKHWPKAYGYGLLARRLKENGEI